MTNCSLQLQNSHSLQCVRLLQRPSWISACYQPSKCCLEYFRRYCDVSTPSCQCSQPPDLRSHQKWEAFWWNCRTFIWIISKNPSYCQMQVTCTDRPCLHHQDFSPLPSILDFAASWKHVNGSAGKQFKCRRRFSPIHLLPLGSE